MQGTINKNSVRDMRHSACQFLYHKEYKAAQDKYIQLINIGRKYIPIIQQDYERALINNPNSIDLKLSLVEISMYIKDFKEAEYELDEVLELDLGNVNAYLSMARIYKEQDRIDDIVTLYEKAYQYTSDEEIIESLVSIYSQVAKYEEAIAVYSKYLDERKRTPKGIKVLAELYLNNKQYEESAQTYMMLLKRDKSWIEEVILKLEKIAGLDKDNDSIKLFLADTYLSAMKPELALKIYEEIAHADPSKLDEMIKKIKKILSKYPDYIPVIIALGNCCISNTLYSEAVMYFAKLMKSNSRYIEDAIAGYKNVLEKCPEQVLARQYLGESYMMVDQVDAAMDQYGILLDYNTAEAGIILARCRSLLRDNESYYPARILLAKCYFVRGEFKRALDEIKRVMALEILQDEQTIKNVHLVCYKMMVDIYFELNDYDGVRSTIRQLLSIDEYNKDLHTFILDSYEKILYHEIHDIKQLDVNETAENLFVLGGKYFEINNIEEAIKCFQVSARDEEYASESYINLGMCFKELGRYDLAINQFKRAYEIQSNQSNYEKMNQISYLIGLAHESIGNLKEASSHYEEIVGYDISLDIVKERLEIINSISWINYAGKSILGILKDFGKKDVNVVWVSSKEAQQSVSSRGESSAASDVSFAQSHNDKGAGHLLKNRIKAAEEEFMLAVQLDANHSTSYNNLGVLYLEKHDYQKAKENFDKSIEIDPTNAVTYANIGLLYYLKDDYKESRIYLEKAINLDPQLKASHINLGDLYYQLKEVNRAFGCWETAYKSSKLPELARRRLINKKSKYVYSNMFQLNKDD